MKKNDLVLIIGILGIALIVMLGVQLYQQKVAGGGALVVVTVDGEERGRYSLDADISERIELGDGTFNVLEIADGYAQISEASCPDQICVKHNHIRYTGETIVCLPNKVVVSVEGGMDRGVDTSTY
ncbi:MAG: NusG domain II-containing protein [Butyrivibrio sp.]|nr:NusG domain II-containing protein [Butyrivibrio sp.]